MKRKLISVLVAGAFLPAFAQAQEPERGWSGSLSVGARNVAHSANDPSKLNEYRHLEGGLAPVLGFELGRRGDSDYLNAFGENLGRDDQYLNLTGGRYGSYRYRLYMDELRHNFGAGPGARTPYNGVGGSTLTGTFPSVNPATWNTFDHSYRRRDLGGALELQAMSPWYVRLDANEVKREGINVFAGSKTTSPGGGFFDLPTPIDYTTRNYTAELGHSTRASHFAVSVHHSTFGNGFDELRWQNDGFGNGLDRTMLPPDNKLTRFAVNGNLRRLPMDSTLAGRVTYSRLTTDVSMPGTQLSTGGAFPATNPSESSFRGDIAKTTASLSLASSLRQNLDSKIYANYLRDKNHSSDITFNPPVGSGLRAGSTNPLVDCANVAAALCEPHKFEYSKKNFGAELGYRMSRANKLSGGVDYTKTDRDRADFPHTRELKLFTGLKNSSIDGLTTRVKYQFTNRQSAFEPHLDVLLANPMDLYVRRFDASNVHQHLVKLGADAALGAFDIGVEVLLKKNEYRGVPLGRSHDNRQEFYAQVGWGSPDRLRLLVFGDLEYVTFESRHRVGLGDPDPAAGPLPGPTYNWQANNQDTSWQVGIGADWRAMPRLKMNTSLIYAKTNGEVDFAAQPPAGTVPSTLPIRNVDNTKRISLVVRGTYDVSKRVELTAGYSHERYSYSDIGYDGFRYVAGAGATASYMSGEFAFQNYSANIVYGVAKYKF